MDLDIHFWASESCFHRGVTEEEGKRDPECRPHHPVGWDPGCIKKDQTAQVFVSLYFPPDYGLSM